MPLCSRLPVQQGGRRRLTLLREPEVTAGSLRAEVLRVTQEVTAVLGAGGGWGWGTSLSLET